MLSNIVFTKNRPLQLHAYLESLYRYFPRELIQTYVIYRVELFDEQYRMLFDCFPDCRVTQEAEFHGDFLRILGRIDTEYVLFGVDDVVFFESVPFDVIDATFKNYPNDAFGFSLRLGVESVGKGGDPIDEAAAAGQTVHRASWAKSQAPNTRYPFELCATVYPTALVRSIIAGTMSRSTVARSLFSPGSTLIRTLSKIALPRSLLKSFGFFFSPNTLESWSCRWCQQNKDNLPNYLYFQRQCASAIQVNMVNVSTANTFDGAAEHTVEALSRSYSHGYRLDIDCLAANKPRTPHCGREVFRLVEAPRGPTPK